MRESPATTPDIIIDKYEVVIVPKGIQQFAHVIFSA